MRLTVLFSFTVVSALTAAIVKRQKPEYALTAAVAAVSALTVAALAAFTPVLTLLRQMASVADNGEEYLTVMLKCSGTAVLASLAGDICADCQQTALARGVRLAANVSMLVFALLIFNRLFEITVKLTGI